MTDTTPSKMRTPLRKVRGLGAAHHGTEHFWLQRLTGIANIPLVCFLIASIVALLFSDYETARAYLGNPVVGVLFAALAISSAIHMRLGMQVVIEDYIHKQPTKAVLLIANSLIAALIGIACLYALVRIGLAA